MADHAYTMTVFGGSPMELQTNLRVMADAIVPNPGMTAPPNGEDEVEETPVPKRRGRPPASQTAQAKGNGTAQTAQTGQLPAAPAKSINQMRQESTDILKSCWGLQPDGAEQVIALQQKFGVKRFAEVGDDKIADLYQQALALQANLSGVSKAPAEDTGPF